MNSRNLTFHEEYSFFSAIMFLVWKIFSVQTVSSVMFFFSWSKNLQKCGLKSTLADGMKAKQSNSQFDFEIHSISGLAHLHGFPDVVSYGKKVASSDLSPLRFLTNNSSFKACSMSSLSSKKIRSGISFWLNELYR